MDKVSSNEGVAEIQIERYAAKLVRLLPFLITERTQCITEVVVDETGLGGIAL